MTTIDGTAVPAGGSVTVATPNGGTVEIFDDGSYTYTPANDFVGTEHLEYTIDDGNGGTDVATLYLSVFDLPPHAEDDINVTTLNQPVDGNVLTNDSSEPDDDLVIADGTGNPITGPTTMTTDQGSTLVINPDGTYTYTPATDFAGEDTITLEVCDENGNCVNSVLTIDVDDTTVDPLNSQPTAGDDNFTSFIDQPLTSSVAGNDGDPDGDVITIIDPATGIAATAAVNVTTAQGGTVVVQPDGTFTYTPAPGFVGVDTFDYSVIDPTGETDDATVTFTVTGDPDPAANDAPDANDDTSVTSVNTVVTGNSLLNDTDPNGDALTVTSIDGLPVPAGGSVVATTPSGGTVEIFEDGSYIYTPATGYFGTENLVYSIDDGNGGTDTATLYLTAMPTPPRATDDINITTIDAPVDGNVLTNDYSDMALPLTVGDGNGNPLPGTTTLTTDQGGTLAIDSDGSYTYTPAAGFVGNDTIILEICDSLGACVDTVLSIDVSDPVISAENTPPVAGDDHFEALTDQVIDSALFGNDCDPDGDVIALVDPATGVAATVPVTLATAQGGTVTIQPDGTFSYTPAAGFTGVDSFDYSIVDPDGTTDDATVTLTIDDDPNPLANDRPTAVDDASITQMNTPQTGNALDNDTDPNGDTLTIVSIDGSPVPAGGSVIVTTIQGSTVEIFDDGSYTYQPANDFVGTEQLVYTIDDGNGGTDDATLSLTVFDLPPVVEDDINNTSIDTPVAGNVLTNDSSEPDDTLTVGDGAGNPITAPTTLTTDQGGTVAVSYTHLTLPTTPYV